jgi:putative ABC transport system permease protein
MGTSFFIGKALLKRNLKMTILIGVIFILCFAGLISALSLQASTNNVYDTMMNKFNTAHILKVFKGQYIENEKIENYLSKDQYVESYDLSYSSEFVKRVKIGKTDDVLVAFQEFHGKKEIDRVDIVEGNKNSEPKVNEAFIGVAFAYKNNIKVGDKMTFETLDGKKELTISAIVVDTLFSSPMINPSRVWISKGQVGLMKGLNDEENMILTVRLHDLGKIQEFNKAFDSNFPDLITEINLDYNATKMISNIMSSVLSIVLFAASIILLLLSGTIIFFVISNEIINDYTYLGVFKGLGFSTKKIKDINRWRYFLMIICSSPIGLILAVILTKAVLAQFEKMTGSFGINIEISLPFVMSFMIVMGIVYLSIEIALTKIRKLEPANAVRFGYLKPQKSVKSKFTVKNTVLHLAIRELKVYPLKALMKGVMISSIATMLFSVSIMNGSLGKIFTPDIAIGAPNSELLVQKNIGMIQEKSENTIKRIKKIEGVDKITPCIVNFSASLLKDNEKTSLVVYCYDKFEGDADIKIIEGRNPQNKYEVAVSKITLAKANKKIGDLIHFRIDGKEGNFLITGTFQTLSNLGHGIRITYDGYKNLNPNIDYNYFAVWTKKDIHSMKLSLQKEFGGQMTVSIMQELIDSSVGTITTGFTILNYILLTMFCLICGFSLVNIIQLHLQENVKNYGILKGIGISDRVIGRIQFAKIVIIALISLGFGMSFAILATPSILLSLLATSGLSEVKTTIPVDGFVVSIGIVLFVTLVSTWLALRKQHTTSLRTLITE